MSAFEVVFNVSPYPDSNVFLPSANIVSIDKGGQLAHLVQRATTATVGAYQLALSPVQERLLGTIDLLAPKALEAKFKPPKAKTTLPLAKLLLEKDTKSVVEGYIWRQMDAFLGEIVRSRLSLTLDAEKKTLAKDVLLAFPKDELLPHLFFNKTASGIEYRLQLGTEDQRWNIREHEVLPLTNTDPAWILVGYALFRVPGINGFMVNPFRKKDVVDIPLSSEKTYFRQFIAKSIRKGRVEATGFRVEKADQLRGTRLEIVENVLENRWVLRPVFEYDGAEFMHGDKRDRITTLDIPKDDAGEVTVHLVCRGPDLEAERLAFLQQIGFQEDNRSFVLPEARESLSGLLSFLAKCRQEAESRGFRIVSPEVGDKVIAVVEQHLHMETKAAGDWFDVQATITVGEHQFPFLRLLPNLRKGDPYFLLPDGLYFLIPEAWFARYADLAGALVVDGDQLRLPKSLYTLLQGENTGASEADLPIIDPQNIDYQPTTDLKAELRPYQLHGVKWLIGHYQHGFGACLADDMGLGKTLQTIAVLLHAKSNTEATVLPIGQGPQLDLFTAYQTELRPLQALIILPASLIFNWHRELGKFAPSLFVYAHLGPKRLKDIRALAGHDVVLTTYHTARQDLELLGKNTWTFIVLDESQQIKNRDSELSKVVRHLRGKHKISLSGTPIENSLADLWTQMEFINPATLGTYKSFREQFQIPIEKQGDATSKQRLFSRVSPFLLRRTKEEVAPDLPALSQQVFYTEMTTAQRDRYESVKSAVRNEILSLFDDPKTRLQALQALTRLRQLANHPVLTDSDYLGDSGKLDDVLAQWDVIRRAGHKVLFFSSFVQHLEIFRRIFDAEKTPYAWLTGEVATKDRAAVVEQFQEDPGTQAFFMTLGAGGVGLNLTAADYVFLLDPWWNPAKEDQAIARAHRIGQANPVTAIRFIARDTVEEKILLLQERKKALGKDLFATSSEEPSLDREDLEMILG